jgi:hypothetical protein
MQNCGVREIPAALWISADNININTLYHLCRVHKEFEHIYSRCQVIIPKNAVFYPIGDLTIRLTGNLDVVICLRASKIGYIVTRQDASISVSF